MLVGGRIPDGRIVMERAREETKNYESKFDIPITGSILADRVGQYMHIFTLYWSVRPLGATTLIASHDQVDGYKLHMIDPNGSQFSYYVCANGKGRQQAKAEFQNHDFSKLTCKESLIFVAKILNQTHEEYKEKKFEYEMSWVCDDSKKKHEQIPKQLVSDALEQARKIIEQQEMGD
eukprot:TRINITY_DN4575_c0_g1_i1.p1 TRINITY_DN4575_c0_g1~~TRINITY_DN4575_c0_g1_i1.p1  ORF type:complete len:177 (-),score=39.41 TRINITY_DN4575_c0_g1_i1:221-751(-)